MVKIQTIWGIFAVFTLASTFDIYVSPDGSDLNSGTAFSSPFLTIEKALTKYREIKSQYTDVIINVDSGDYRLNKPIILGFQDSPIGSLAIKGSKEKPVLKGSISLEGDWKSFGTNNIWFLENVDQIIEIATGNPPVDSLYNLYVNDKRAIRAREPNYGSGSYFKSLPSADSRNSMNWNEDDINSLWNYSDAMFVRFRTNSYTKNFVESLDFSQKIVKLVDSNYLVESNHRIDGNLYFYENVFGALDAPGEYFINLTESRIYYIPLPDEDIQTASFELGILSQMLIMDGPISNIHVDNLAFEYTTSKLSRNLEKDDLEKESATIQISGCSNCSITNVQVSHTGMFGIHLDSTNSNIQISNSNFQDIGAGGIKINKDCTNCLESKNNIQQENSQVFSPINTETETNELIARQICSQPAQVESCFDDFEASPWTALPPVFIYPGPSPNTIQTTTATKSTGLQSLELYDGAGNVDSWSPHVYTWTAITVDTPIEVKVDIRVQSNSYVRYEIRQYTDTYYVGPYVDLYQGRLIATTDLGIAVPIDTWGTLGFYFGVGTYNTGTYNLSWTVGGSTTWVNNLPYFAPTFCFMQWFGVISLSSTVSTSWIDNLSIQPTLFSKITTSVLTTSVLTTSPVTSGPMTTGFVTSSELTTSFVTSAAVTSAQITSSEMTTSPITSGLALITSGLAPITSGISPITSGIAPITSGIDPAPITSGVAATPITSGLSPITSGITPITSGITPITSGVSPLTTSPARASTGASPLTSGSPIITTSPSTTSRTRVTTGRISTTGHANECGSCILYSRCVSGYCVCNDDYYFEDGQCKPADEYPVQTSSSFKIIVVGIIGMICNLVLLS